jgi:site-specific recombinase XerC
LSNAVYGNVAEVLVRARGAAEKDRWLITEMMYSAGLRLCECLRLRIQDIDFERREITVCDGKGAQDRVTMWPESVKEPLQQHLRQIKKIDARDLADGWGRVSALPSYRKPSNRP